MEMFATLRRSGGVEALARHLELQPVECADAAEALLPHVLARLRRIYSDSGEGQGGVDALVRLIEPLCGNERLFALHEQGTISGAQRQRILSTLVGSQADVGALVAAAAHRHRGVPSQRLAAMLPLLLMLVGGYMVARIAIARDAGEDVVAGFEALVPGVGGQA